MKSLLGTRAGLERSPCRWWQAAWHSGDAALPPWVQGGLEGARGLQTLPSLDQLPVNPPASTHLLSTMACLHLSPQWTNLGANGGSVIF